MQKLLIPLAEIKDYNVVMDGRNVFEQHGLRDDYTTSCLVDYN